MFDQEESATGSGARPQPWVRCGRCTELVYGPRFTRNLRVCPTCAEHARLTAHQRLAQLLDPGSCAFLDEVAGPHDPLGFTDLRPYVQRLDEARAATGLREAVVCAGGSLEGRQVVVAAMDFRFLGGSLGCGVGARITDAARLACDTRTPLLIVTASGGARMQEGALSLMQMAKTAQAVAELNDAGVFVASLVTDPTYGGVAASFATLADVILAEPGARLGFAGPRVIEQTTGERLPEGFQTAEFLLDHGLIDDIVPRRAQRGVLARLFDMCAPAPGRTAEGQRERIEVRAAAAPDDGCTGGSGAGCEGDPWTAVRLARHPGRPSTLDYAHTLLDGFHELHGDRVGADCAAVVGGPGKLNGAPVMLVGHEKGGNDLAERRRRGFGMPGPAGYRKAARLMRLAARLGVPVVTLIDTPGADPGPDSERGGQAVAIAENLRLMARLPVPLVAVVTGEGGSGGALAFAVADRVLVAEHGFYSVISPEGCAAILWKDADAAPEAAAALRIHPDELLRLGVVDAVVPEPPGGAHTDHGAAAALLREALTITLEELKRLDTAHLLRERTARFQRFGAGPDALGAARVFAARPTAGGTP